MREILSRILDKTPTHPDFVIGSSEPQKAEIEVQHYGKYDLLFDRNSPSFHALSLIKTKLASEDPALWDKHPDEMVHEHIRVDNKDNPQVVIKRREDNQVDIKHLHSGINNRNKYIFVDIKEVYAINSVINEITLAPFIRSVIASGESQALVQSFGFESIDYIHPLLAIVDRARGKKYVAYNYVNALTFYKTSKLPEGFTDENAEILTEEIGFLLENKGIVATDLVPRQFLVQNNSLLLIDSEAYYWKSPTHRARVLRPSTLPVRLQP